MSKVHNLMSEVHNLMSGTNPTQCWRLYFTLKALTLQAFRALYSYQYIPTVFIINGQDWGYTALSEV